MEIIEYTSEMQKQIGHCYNNLTANVPHCYPVNDDELGKVLMCPVYETEDKKLLQAQMTFVAREGTNVRGFIQVGIGPCDFVSSETNPVKDRSHRHCLKKRKTT